MYPLWTSGSHRYDPDTEDLRQKLSDEVYAGGFSGMPAMLLDLDRIQKADDDELHEIARTYGYE